MYKLLFVFCLFFSLSYTYAQTSSCGGLNPYSEPVLSWESDSTASSMQKSMNFLVELLNNTTDKDSRLEIHKELKILDLQLQDRIAYVKKREVAQK